MEATLKKHFYALKKIINNALVDKEKERMNKKLDGLFKKGQSKDIHVAVVGEFNSGKSTFINALLRERILKEASQPTTAAATYITRSKPHHFLQYIMGTRSYVTVAFNDGHSFQVHKNNYSLCAAYIQQTYHIQTQSLHDLIQVITSEQAVAQHVVYLHLELKTSSIPKNVVILDTPGFNPGETQFNNHLKITEDVVTNIADMAFILIPSTQPMSLALVNFLKNNIHRYIHRCVFLVTKIDLIPEEEREMLYEYIRNQVRKLGVASPHVYGISARTMLPVRKIPESMQDTWSLYQKEFCKFEKENWKELARYKEIAIREHVYHLMNLLSEKIKNTIDEHTQKIQQTLQTLNNNPIKPIKELTDEIYKVSCSKLDLFYANVECSTESCKGSTQNTCNSIIRKGGKLRNYKQKEAIEINQVIIENNKQYTASVINCMKSSIPIIQDEIARFRNKFHIDYKDMPSLEPPMDYALNTTAIPTKAINLSVLRSLKNKYILIRWIMNIINYFKKEEKIQEKVIEEVDNAIDNHFNELEMGMRNAIESIKEGQKKDIKDYLDQHVQQYGKQIEILIQQQTEKKHRLGNNISINKGYIEQISGLQESIKKEISLLLEK